MLYDAVGCLIYILAVYGLLVLILSIAESIRCRVRDRRPKVRIILLVRNAEEHIEYIVRSAVKKDMAGRLLSDAKIAVVDTDSSDNTYMLLEKLQNAYPGIEVFKLAEMDKILTDHVKEAQW